MTRAGDVDDLSVLSRRGELSVEEQQRLSKALELSATEQFLHQAGRGFDLEATIMVGDEQLIERVTRRLEPKRVERRLLPRWRFAAGVAAGLVLAAAGALGLELTRAWIRPELPVAAPPAAPDAARTPTPRPVSPAPTAEPVPPASTTSGERAVLPGPAKSRVRELAPAMPAESRQPAHELFAAANRARSRGDTALAMALYRQLQSEQPRSPEAGASRLSLGMLLLQKGEPALALEQFRAYRQDNPAAMSAEALFSEAEAHRQLGRHEDERRALGELTARFPQSAYAVAAAKRLKQDP